MANKITRREFIIEMALSTAAFLISSRSALSSSQSGASNPGFRPPNFILILTDDQGYADAGCYGAKDIKTPNLDRMAANGIRFTDFYASHSICSPSRAGILTGCYPARVGINRAMWPWDKIGLNPDETTIGDILKPLGYATACVGKWHLGHLKPFLPTNQGFDEYFGLPYSNDMWPVKYDGTAAKRGRRARYPKLPLLDGEEPVRTIETLEDQNQLTTLYTERAVQFINKNKGRPFFLYLAHSMPHVPLGVSGKFRGKSRQGMYGDVIMEIDWSVGEILKALKVNDIDDNTLVVFTSDSGPSRSFGKHGGSAGLLREGKGTTWEGGQRVIGIMQWPNRILAGTVCSEMVSAIDLLPTFAELAGANLPERKIDGKSIMPLILGHPGSKTPHEALFYYFELDGQLQCVRSGKWKLHFPHTYWQCEGFKPGKDGYPGGYRRGRIGLALYDLEKDIGERNNVADQYPDVVTRLKQLGEAHQKEIRANARKPGHYDGKPSKPQK